MARRSKGSSSALENLTGLSAAEIDTAVSKAYRARFGEALPAVHYDNARTDETTRVYFDVVGAGGTMLGSGVYKPKRGSFWIEWAE